MHIIANKIGRFLNWYLNEGEKEYYIELENFDNLTDKQKEEVYRLGMYIANGSVARLRDKAKRLENYGK